MKRILLIFAFVLAAVAGFSQAKKPIIMVVPSDVWCNQRGYMMEFNNQGVKERLPDYNAALQGDPDLLLAISKLGEIMSERGFPLKDLGASLKSLRTQEAEDAVTTSKDGDAMAASPLDKLKDVAKADIWIQLTYKVNQIGPKRSLTLNLQGLDAYSDKQVAAASGTSAPSFSVEVPVLIQEAIIAHMDQFTSQLQAHFDDLFEKGREVSLLCRRWSGSSTDFETEFGGKELNSIIEDWAAANTVNGSFSLTESSENRMTFEQVRIPMIAASGRGLDARTWANGLRKELKEKYNIDAKLSMKGLGKAIITIGGK